jgi:rare lipoprotein A
MKGMKPFVLIAAILLFGLLPIALLFSSESEHPLWFEEGIASWYTSDPDGPLTANGERFDPNALSAAHKSLPFGTVVRVHDKSNGLQVDVRINDRGPYVDGRIIDLTPTAARVIQMYERGISEVALEILYEPRIPESQYNRPGDTGWYKIQLGAFSNTRRVYELYSKLHDLGFKPAVEIIDERLLRLSIRWIPEDEKDASLKILSSLGFPDVLLRGEEFPY